MHNHNMLEVNNLSKNFAGTGRETEFAAVDGISFTLDAGECLGLIGESGCGKSTTARLITGLVQADAGSVLLEGEEILGRKGRRQREVYRKIQMVFQTPQDSFDPMQTLETGILEAFRNQGMSRKEACLHLPELLKKVELSSETAMRYPRETSCKIVNLVFQIGCYRNGAVAVGIRFYNTKELHALRQSFFHFSDVMPDRFE